MEPGERKEQRRRQAVRDFARAKSLAENAGFELKQCQPAVHYQLIRLPELLLNIYPGNRRLYHDKKYTGPFIHIPDGWDGNLVTIVCAVIEELGYADKPCQPGDPAV